MGASLVNWLGRSCHDAGAVASRVALRHDRRRTTPRLPMAFLTEPEPERGANLPIIPGISRIVANNPGPMTYFGTNTYLIDTEQGLVILDPGPEDHPEHVEAIMRHTGGQVSLILISHTHHDHVGAAEELKQKTGAP